MKKLLVSMALVAIGFGYFSFAYSRGENKADDSQLKVVFIRHGEKPDKGSNLTCKGLNRSQMLPAVITGKFGVPNYIYVPTLKMAEKTGHARMFETVIPLASKYNIDIDSKFDETDSTGVSKDILAKKGTVLVVWEHKNIRGILHAMGIKDTPEWPADDYDTMYIITFKDGKPVLAKDKEGINPSDSCR